MEKLSTSSYPLTDGDCCRKAIEARDAKRLLVERELQGVRGKQNEAARCYRSRGREWGSWSKEICRKGRNQKGRLY